MIPFNIPPFVPNSETYIHQAIAARKICGDGMFTKRCSEALEAMTGTSKALLTTSCTSAMEMAAIFRLLLISKNSPFSRGTPTNVELFTKCVSHHRSNRYWGTLRAHPGPPGTT